MRLIDADAFKEQMGTETKIRRMMCDAIDNQPTAYNVDKVVAELEKLKSNLGFGGTIQQMYADGKVDNAIDIVRKGGVE